MPKTVWIEKHTVPSFRSNAGRMGALGAGLGEARQLSSIVSVTSYSRFTLNVEKPCILGCTDTVCPYVRREKKGGCVYYPDGLDDPPRCGSRALVFSQIEEVIGHDVTVSLRARWPKCYEPAIKLYSQAIAKLSHDPLTAEQIAIMALGQLCNAERQATAQQLLLDLR